MNDKKPAFPFVVPKGIGTPNSPIESGVVTGLTKREVFAMNAMQGLLSNAPFVQSLGHYNLDHKALINVAVGVADELLKQLEK